MYCQAYNLVEATGHPSEEIIGTEEGGLCGIELAFGVGGGAAAYKAIDIIRKLMRWGASIHVLLTHEASKLVGRTLFEWATTRPPIIEFTGATEHVLLAKRVKALVVAPATLNLIAEIVSGGASRPLTALAQELLGLGKSVLLVPAMHKGMYSRAAKLLASQSENLYVMPPYLVEGRAKFPPVELVAWWIESVVTRGQDLAGLKILVTAGPTREHLDPIRCITNPSSGLMGLSIAFEAFWRGARVLLVHGPLHPALTEWLNYAAHSFTVRKAVSTEDMMEKVVELAKRFKPDMVFYAAAPADFKPERQYSEKLSSKEVLNLQLVPTPKIVKEVVKVVPEAIHIAFAAEWANSDEDLIERGLAKLQEYGVDIIAVNNAKLPGEAFESLTNRLMVISRRGVRWMIKRAHKRLVARQLLDIAASEYALKYQST
ncbi:MAG TPA: bifunctional phosphopantothenoylcysteine decarboxylase/phosphopantothenate--cysteine ligase CoaBC [Pyrodictium sp.]|nr:bifunctional phosphopantothenoylcysteine decarboxylase/phosphopantothenate--cysteine ligase CoaBC [Pyrodictium sp.]